MDKLASELASCIICASYIMIFLFFIVVDDMYMPINIGGGG